MEMDNNLPSNSTSSSVQENVNQQPPITNQNEPSKSIGKNRPGMMIIAVVVIVILVLLGVGGYYLYSTQKGNTQISKQENTTPSKPSEFPQTNVDTSQYGTAAFVFISANGRIAFLKEKAVDTSQWGGLTRVGELWSFENDKPTKLVDDAPVIDFVWAPDGNKLVYFKQIPKPQGRLPFVKDAYASGGFAEGDVIYYDLLTKEKTVVGKFSRSDWQTPYDLPKWSNDSTEVIFEHYSGYDDEGNTENTIRKFNAKTHKNTDIPGSISIRYISPNLERAVITDKKEEADSFSIRNLKTDETRVVGGLQTIAPGGSVYTYLWSPDNNNLAIVINEQQSKPEDYDLCVLYVFDASKSSVSSAKKMEQKFNYGSCGYGNTQPIWSPNGHYVQLENQLMSVNPSLYPLPNVKIDERRGGGPSGAQNGVTWSPDSTMFADNISGKLSIHNLRTGKTIAIDGPVGNWVGVGYKAWFPDNSRLVYNKNGNLVSVKSDGTDKKVLAN